MDRTLLSLLFTFCYFVVPSRSITGLKSDKYITLGEGIGTCTPSMPCRYALCMWERQVHINSDTCAFIDSGCTCPTGTVCSLTREITHRSNLMSFTYRCEAPFIFFKQGAKTIRANRVE